MRLFISAFCAAASLSAFAVPTNYLVTNGYGLGNSLLRQAVENTTTHNLIAVGRFWNGSQFKGLIGAFRISDGAADQNFATKFNSNGKLTFDFVGSSLENTCMAVTKVNGTSYVAACRAVTGDGSYETYLVKFDSSGNLDSNFNTVGYVATGLHTVPGQEVALVRGIAYNANVNAGNNGVVTIVGAYGNYPSSLHPFIASFDQKTGAAFGSITTVSSITGTAIGVVYDSTNSFYYMASTDLSTPHRIYVHQFNNTLTATGGSWGAALNLTTGGGAGEDIPTAIVESNDKTRVYVVGSDETYSGNTATGPWRCLVVAVKTSNGTLDTGFGKYALPTGSGTNLSGVSLFSHDTGSPLTKDCELNAITTEVSGGTFEVGGTGFNTTYDFLTAQLDSTGTLVGTFGTSGVKTLAGGSNQDVVNSLLYVNGDTTKLYAVGRQQGTTFNMMAIDNFSSSTGAATAASTDTWVTTAPSGTAPTARQEATGVWDGTYVSIFGGWNGVATYYSTGARYNPVANSWSTMTTSSAPAVRAGHSAIWTGTKMIVFGGYNGTAALNSGGIYDPATDVWTVLTTTSAPTARYGHSAAWTGSKMIVFGGWDGSTSVNTGGLYDPTGASWTATTTTSAPSDRYDHTAVWTGSKMIVWGGYSTSNGGEMGDGSAFDPSTSSTGSWSSISNVNAPFNRMGHFAAWTGTYMLIYGGTFGGSYVNLLQGYKPSGDTWTQATPSGEPSNTNPAVAWTDSSLVVWGGQDASSVYQNSGSRYTPAANTWSATTTSGAPSAAAYSTGVWTGSTMVIFGGTNGTVNNSVATYSP